MTIIDEPDTITVRRIITVVGEVVWSYENDCGAMVATRTLPVEPGTCKSLDHWIVRLYTSPDDVETYRVPTEDAAERLCLDHASWF